MDGMRSEQIAVSPCSNPELELEGVLAAYALLGFRQFEGFTSWVKSALDYHGDAEAYLAAGRRHGMAFTSLHLPLVRADRLDETLREAVAAARFAGSVGARTVLFKASDRATYVRAAKGFLDAIEGFGVTPVIQNYYGSPLSSLDDVREVYEQIADPRLRTLLEVGHFHSAGVAWRDAAEYLADSIALVHVKDQVGSQSVPFGQGEIDLPGLFRYMDDRAYEGLYVIEMEVRDKENTLAYLADARRYVLEHCAETE